MKVRPEDLEEAIKGCVRNNKIEDAIILILFKYRNSRCRDEEILAALNKYLKMCGKLLFNMEDFLISKKLLIQRGLINYYE